MNELTTNPRMSHLWLIRAFLVALLAGAIGERVASAQGFQLRVEHGHPCARLSVWSGWGRRSPS